MPSAKETTFSFVDPPLWLDADANYKGDYIPPSSVAIARGINRRRNWSAFFVAASKPTRNHNTIGWICALSICAAGLKKKKNVLFKPSNGFIKTFFTQIGSTGRATVAIAMFDKQPSNLSQALEDFNTYTLGCIGEHNIVIVCLSKRVKVGVKVATSWVSPLPRQLDLV